MATVRISSGDPDDPNEIVAPVIDKNQVIVQQESFGSKLGKAIVGQTAKDIGEFFVFEVLVPGFKRGLSSVFNFALYGSSYNRRRSYDSPYYGGSTYSYRSHYQYRDDDYDDYDDYDYAPPRRSRERRARRDYDRSPRVDYRNIILLNEDDAKDLVDYMKARIKRYGKVSRLELLDKVKLPFSHVDENMGWIDPDDIGYLHVTHPSEGFLIDVAEAIDIRGY